MSGITMSGFTMSGITMKRVFLAAMVAVMLVAVPVLAADKYDVVDVKGGGSIKGKIKATSTPADPMLTINKDTEFCGKDQKAGMYVVAADGGVKNVIVAVMDVAKGKAIPKTDTIVDNKKCEFAPLVSVAYKGQNYKIRNSDPIFHNTSLGLMLGDKRRTVYNLALPNKDQEITKAVKVAGMQDLKCDAHAWMRGFVYASDSPYATVTDDKGNFEIKDLLPGKYKVMIWHEGFGQTEQSVEVKAGAATDMDATLSKK